MSREMYPLKFIGETRARKEAELWKLYDRCEECRALPGMPCREAELVGNFKKRKNPHPFRRRREAP